MTRTPAKKATRRPARKKATPARQAAPAEGTKSARTRERILDAAASVLSEKGYSGTRLADVAEKAQVQAPAIYYYYPSREDLIEEVMYAGISRVREHIEQLLDELPDGTDPLDRILVAVEAHLRFFLESSDYTKAAIRNQGQVPAELRSRYDAETVKYGALWSGLFDSAAREGSFRIGIDPRMSQMLLLGALNWTPEWWDGKRGSVDDLVANAKAIVKHTLTP